jgi:hypothetical protein
MMARDLHRLPAKWRGGGMGLLSVLPFTSLRPTMLFPRFSEFRRFDLKGATKIFSV